MELKVRSKRKIICLTPVKNEGWILNYFLKATSLWADHIIIADQGSTDNSVQIAKSYSKVILIENNNNEYDEKARQYLLIKEARKIEGENNIFFALDADEILVNFTNNFEWNKIFHLSPGSCIWLPWLNVMPDKQHYFESFGGRSLFIYINDNNDHNGKIIHSPRLPFNENSEKYNFNNLIVLHFQYISRQRLLSKQRWYQVYEKLKYPKKNNIDIYRLYHHFEIKNIETKRIDPVWYEFLMQNDIHIMNIDDDGIYWWDKDVCQLFQKYGLYKFKKLAIWEEVNWDDIFINYFPNNHDFNLKDPRNQFDKLVHFWLKSSQHNRFNIPNKLINKILRLLKW